MFARVEKIDVGVMHKVHIVFSPLASRLSPLALELIRSSIGIVIVFTKSQRLT